MKKINVLAALLFITGSVFAQTWSLDKAHAKLGFGVTHLLISEVQGSFKSFDVTLTSSKDDFSDATIDLSADVNTIYTDQEKRDADLRGEGYFDVAKYPKLSFKSKSFNKVEGKKYKLSGDLTIHGVTKAVVLDVIYNGTIVHPFNKKNVAGFKITGTIKRSDFGVGAKTPEAVVSDEITINANAEFIKG